MGAQRERIVWRYTLGQVVYVQGSREPYLIDGRQYVALRDPPSRERTYQLVDTQGATFWLAEHHIYTTPAKSYNVSAHPQGGEA